MSDRPSKHPDPMRRQVVTALAGSVALAACGGTGGVDSGGSGGPGGSAGKTPLPVGTIPPDRAGLPRPALPDPALSGIDHIVLVTMENRSFDHLLGWLPNAEGLPPNRQFTDAFGQVQTPFALATNPAYGFQGCAFADPNHAYEGGRVHFANGAMNGFLMTPGTSLVRGDQLPVGYFRQEDMDFFRGVASQYTVCDYYMSGILADTYPNRIYLHSGETDRLSDSLDTSALPTLWDRLDAKNVSSKYYFHDVPFTALYGTRYVRRSRFFGNFLSDAAAGTLPSFCMVDPRFSGEQQGTSNDDHPHADIRNGQVLLGQIYEALRTSPAWSSTLMIIVYDEWGGFMEHVAPPVRPVSAAEQALGNDGRLGFRVPCMLIGPRVRANTVSRYPFDPSSIHQLVAWRFGLDPLGVRATDAATFNMAYALDFQNAARTDAPQIAVAQGTFGTKCTVSAGAAAAGVGQLDQAAARAASDGSMNTSDPGGRFNELRVKAIALGYPVAP